MTNQEAGLIAILAHFIITLILAIYLRKTRSSFNETINTAYQRYKNADSLDLKLVAFIILLVVLLRRSQGFGVVAYFLIDCRAIVSIFSPQKGWLDIISEFIENIFNSEAPPEAPTIPVTPNGQ